jgi:hypothetical protein
VVPEKLILIRHSGLRTVTEAEILSSLPESVKTGPREFFHVDTARFGSDVDAGDWATSERYLRECAREIRVLADEADQSTELHYFGLAEIPHIVALGAFIGDERHVATADFDRQRDRWEWREQEKTLTLKSSGVPSERVTQSGIAVVRLSLSAAISDDDVTAAVGLSRLADVVIEPAGERVPQVQLVRSSGDVEHVRETVRSVLSAIAANRPAVEAIHLFIAAPVSACFIIGQELHLRSSVPVVTYRFRRVEGQPSYTEAIRLTASDLMEAPPPLSVEDHLTAESVRTLWQEALASVLDFAAVRKREPVAPAGIWYGALRIPSLIAARPFPALPPLWTLADDRDGVASEPYAGEYGLDKDNHCWRLSDRLLIGLHASVGGDKTELRRLIQLFLFHEYAHEHNGLTAYTAASVGAFPNCLERVDYAADVYGIFHQLAWAEMYERAEVRDDDARRRYVARLIELALRSFWAFDQPLPIREWQVRRLRRYLNWYWRLVQVRRAPSLETAIWTLSRPPAVELSGIAQRVLGRRVMVVLSQRLQGEHLELAVVLENEKLLRVGDSPVANLDALLSAFANGDHDAIVGFFNTVYEEAAAWNGQFAQVLETTP